jgi:dTDP-4-amino-4,6-dideoxygalactose transaminase
VLNEGDVAALEHLAEILIRDKLGAKHESGYYNQCFAKGFAALYGVPFATTFSSGSAALEAALFACDVGPHDEVIVDPFLKYAPLAAVRRRAVPVFADVLPETLVLSPEAVARAVTPRTKAVIVTALFGQPVTAAPYRTVLGGAPVRLVADCAQALLAERAGSLAGPDFDVATFSFQESKHLSTGEGGMLITPDRAIFERAVELKDFGWRPGRADAEVTEGWMYRMAEPLAAIGTARLRSANALVTRHREIAAAMTEVVADCEVLRVVGAFESGHACWTWAAEILNEAARAHLAVLFRGEDRLQVGYCRAGLNYERPLFGSYPASDPALATQIERATCSVAKDITPRLVHVRIDARRDLASHLSDMHRLRNALAGV